MGECTTAAERKMASRIDAIYARQGAIQEKVTSLMEESRGLRKENDALLKRLGWW